MVRLRYSLGHYVGHSDRGELFGDLGDSTFCGNFFCTSAWSSHVLAFGRPGCLALEPSSSWHRSFSASVAWLFWVHGPKLEAALGTYWRHSLLPPGLSCMVALGALALWRALETELAVPWLHSRGCSGCMGLLVDAVSGANWRHNLLFLGQCLFT
mmetsp:Transcript_16327/g.52274  ORF Transcript_16327/g.52274 Transcript_16327/m.52274 type:complete len:155 (+) Transcript_16327:661-1125(+)